jgi:bifunctional DNA-binding transcriptional regulator/antitoxin component of YhaV-PrlF toxin-antitoxin module
MKEYKAVVEENGSFFVPASLCKQMNLSPGEEILMTYDDYSVYMLPLKQVLKETQGIEKELYGINS